MTLDFQKTLKKHFFNNALISFMLFSSQFHEASTMVGLKAFQTFHKQNSIVYSPF